jgi:uncharacterized protein
MSVENVFCSLWAELPRRINFMSPEEKNVIGGIFERLKGAANAQRDVEAEKFIADQIKAQPYAPYVMAQSIYAQEQALTSMQQQIEQLQGQVQQLEQYAQQVQQQPQSGGFLGGLFGGGAKPVAPPPMNRAPFQRGGMQQPPGMQAQGMAPPAGPWGGQPQGAPPAGPWGQQQPQRQGMGFLGTAMTTAAGVAGGMLAANALSNMFSGGSNSAGSGAQASAGSAAAGPASSPEPTQASTSDNYGYGSDAQSASYDDSSYDDGGGDDWA